MNKIVSSLVIGGLCLSGQGFCDNSHHALKKDANRNSIKKVDVSAFKSSDSKKREADSSKSALSSKFNVLVKKGRIRARSAWNNPKVRNSLGVAVLGGGAGLAYLYVPGVKNFVNSHAESLGIKLGLIEKPVVKPSFWKRHWLSITATPFVIGGTSTLAIVAAKRSKAGRNRVVEPNQKGTSSRSKNSQINGNSFGRSTMKKVEGSFKDLFNKDLFNLKKDNTNKVNDEGFSCVNAHYSGVNGTPEFTSEAMQ